MQARRRTIQWSAFGAVCAAAAVAVTGSAGAAPAKPCASAGGQQPSSTTAPAGGPSAPAGATTAADGTVSFARGFETDRRDGGRPVVLIAAALGVPTEVFRTAFSGVTPADPAAGPTSEEAHANKEALLAVLAPYGITNERLDEVSNHYRFNGSAGETWTHRAATAAVVRRNGAIVGVRLVRPGAGYSSAPVVRVAGHPELRVVAKLAFGTDLATNGRIASLTLR